MQIDCTFIRQFHSIGGLRGNQMILFSASFDFPREQPPLIVFAFQGLNQFRIMDWVNYIPKDKRLKCSGGSALIFEWKGFQRKENVIFWEKIRLLKRQFILNSLSYQNDNGKLQEMTIRNQIFSLIQREKIGNLCLRLLWLLFFLLPLPFSNCTSAICHFHAAADRNCFLSHIL